MRKHKEEGIYCTFLLLPCIPLGTPCASTKYENHVTLIAPEHIFRAENWECTTSTTKRTTSEISARVPLHSPLGSKMPGFPVAHRDISFSQQRRLRPRDNKASHNVQKCDVRGCQSVDCALTSVHISHSGLLEETVQSKLVVIACVVRQRLSVLSGLVKVLLHDKQWICQFKNGQELTTDMQNASH